jgi:hypothetical protein
MGCDGVDLQGMQVPHSRLVSSMKMCAWRASAGSDRRVKDYEHSAMQMADELRAGNPDAASSGPAQGLPCCPGTTGSIKIETRVKGGGLPSGGRCR